jgi:hypothetical protein
VVTVRKLLGVALATCALLVPSSAAFARGGGWQPAEFAPFDAACGETVVHVTFPVNREYVREIDQEDGTVVLQYTGYVEINYATDDGASLTVNSSGPTKLLIYPNGDIEFMVAGPVSGPPPFEGLPDLIWTFGRADIVFHEDGSYTVIKFPQRLVDICTELGLSE